MASWQTTALNVALHLTVKRMMNSSGSVEAPGAAGLSHRAGGLPQLSR